MTFVMVIVTAAALALANSAGAAAAGGEKRFVAQIPAGANLGRLSALLRTTEGVSAVEPVSQEQMRRTLGRWLGAAAESPDLPVPALIHFDIMAQVDVIALEQRLAKSAPGTSISAHAAELGPLLKTMRAVQWLALSLVGLMMVATCATVILAAKAALDTNRSTIEIMHGIGATDLQVTYLFQRRVAIDAALGATVGALSGLLTLALLAGGSRALEGQLGGAPVLDAGDFLLLALLPVVLVTVATWVARAAVLRTLRQTP